MREDYGNVDTHGVHTAITSNSGYSPQEVQLSPLQRPSLAPFWGVVAHDRDACDACLETSN